MLDYDAVIKVFKKIKEDFGDKRIGIPLTGAVLACGDWNRISKSIEDVGFNDLTVVCFNKKDYVKCMPFGNWESLPILS